MSRSEEKTGWGGDKYTVHYDDNGNKIGESHEKSGWGSPYIEHTDASGNKIGESREKSGWGNPYTEHTGDFFGGTLTKSDQSDNDSETSYDPDSESSSSSYQDSDYSYSSSSSNGSSDGSGFLGWLFVFGGFVLLAAMIGSASSGSSPVFNKAKEVFQTQKPTPIARTSTYTQQTKPTQSKTTVRLTDQNRYIEKRKQTFQKPTIRQNRTQNNAVNSGYKRPLSDQSRHRNTAISHPAAKIRKPIQSYHNNMYKKTRQDQRLRRQRP